jgi:hypothetical protein
MSFDPVRKGKKVLADDGMSERLICNFHNCLITNMLRKGSKDTRRLLVTGVSCRISFKVDQYRSHFEISIITPKNAEGDLFRTSYLRFDAICSIEYTLRGIERDEYKALCGENEKVHEHNQCYQLSMRYDSEKLCAENLFTDDCPVYVADLCDYLRNSQVIAFFIRGSAQIAVDFDNLTARLRQDRARNPLLRWYPKGMSPPAIQNGMYLKAKDRPSIGAVPTIYTFFDWLDYMTRYGFGHIYNQEHIKSIADPFSESLHEMFFFELYGGGDRRIMFFLRMSPSDKEVRLQPNDKLNVLFDEEQDITQAWSATITEPMPYSPLAVVTGYITRPWNREKKGYKNTTELKAVSWKVLHNPQRALDIILGQTPYQVGLRLVASDNEFTRSLSSLEHLNRIYSDLANATPRQKEDLKYVLGNHFDTVKKIDMYESVAAKMPNLEEIMELNEGQALAVKTSRSIGAGRLLIHGGPGTGKTYLVVEMCKPFFVDDVHHRILICSANNTGVDNAALRAHQVLTKLQKEGNADLTKYVVRLHSFETERLITEKDAKLARAKPEGSRPKCVQEFGNDELEILDRLDMAKVIRDEYQRGTATRFEGIHDKRVTNLEISLGNRMLQVAGIALDFTNKPEGDRFPWAKPNDPLVQGFVDSYRTYLDGEEMDHDRSKVFKAQTKRLAELTVDGAEVLAGTLATVATPLVANAYSKAEGLVIDEAARVMESQSWPIMEKYGELVWKLLVGDPDQLPPVVQSNEKTNPFAGQLRLSQMHRLESAGATTVFLPEQARALEEIAKAYSRVIYQGRLTHAPSTAVERRPIAQAVRAFNLKRFNLSSNLVYIDLTDSESEMVGTGSVYNDKNCQFTLNLVEELLNANIPGDIGILGCYQAQYRCYSSGLMKMSKVYPQVLGKVETDKIDRRQGSEFDIVIVDLTRSQGSGFMRDKKRLNVLFSRAKNGLYVVGRKKCIDSLNISNGKFLQKFQSEYLRFCRHLTAPMDCAWYQPGQVNVGDAEDEDLEPDDDITEKEGEEEGKEENAPIEASGPSFPVLEAKKQTWDLTFDPLAKYLF